MLREPFGEEFVDTLKRDLRGNFDISDPRRLFALEAAIKLLVLGIDAARPGDERNPLSFMKESAAEALVKWASR